MKAKMGLCNDEEGDTVIVEDLLAWMQRQQADFTNTFRTLSREDSSAASPFPDPEFCAWHARWTERRARQPEKPSAVLTMMRRHNPAVIPRNHKVEEALNTAVAGDINQVHRLLEVLAKPYDHDRTPEEYQQPPAPGQQVCQTFCGT